VDLEVQHNRFTFEDIEPNVGIKGFVYSPQDSVGEVREIIIEQDSSLVISVGVGGSANEYQWLKDGVEIESANSDSYAITSADSGDIGRYVCRITNTIATELALYSRPIHVVFEGTVGIDNERAAFPGVYDLKQNYPNPFNPVTTIGYDLPEAVFVRIEITDVLGRTVKTLVSGDRQPGHYQITWNGADDNGFAVSSGLYFYTMRSKDHIRTKKLLLLR
jgi:hypothetical protein